MYSLKPRQILRFWKWVKKLPNGCWEWQASITTSGYGRFAVYPKTLRAHKVAYFLCKGKILEDQFVCHTCDNPRCVNPDHLWIGTSKQNTKDMIFKGRLNRSRSKHKDSISKYPGISFRKEKKTNAWRARIMRNYHTIWCKEFATEEDAHLARKAQLEIISS